MDVGGTQIKAQTFVKSKPFSDGITSFEAKSGCGKSEIFENFAGIISSLLMQLPTNMQKLEGVGMAFPGPFDYKNGVSLMKGLGKYDAIYGCGIRQELIKLLPQMKSIDIPFVFLHDIEAFAIGQTRFGAVANSPRAMFVCIGTGAGSAFTENGVVLKKPMEGVPENGWIYNTAYRDSIIDDYISARGLAKITARYFDNSLDGLAIEELSNQGDSRARAVLSEFGEDVCGAIAPFLRSFKPDTLVFGGQISKSFHVFGKTVEELCDKLGIKIVVSFNTSDSILKGLMSVLAELSALENKML